MKFSKTKIWLKNFFKSFIWLFLPICILGDIESCKNYIESGTHLTPYSVSVRGYYRKDGTYVHAYKRRPPGGVKHDAPYENQRANMSMLFILCLIGGAVSIIVYASMVKSEIEHNSKPQNITVVHVNDHSLFRKGVRLGLSKKKDIHIISEADNGLELFELLKTITPDIILLDYQMPKMDGMQTLKRLSVSHPHIKVIILCMHNDEETIKAFMSRGARSYLTMNIESEAIYNAIKGVHQYGYYYSDPIAKALTGVLKKLEWNFSSKELFVFKLLKSGMSIKAISLSMNMDKRTIEAMIDKMKTQAKSIADLLNSHLNEIT